MFAKLYGTDDKQVLVKLDEGEEGPEIRFYFQPAGLGVCSVATYFEDSDEGHTAAQQAFDKVDEAHAFSITDKAKQTILQMRLTESPSLTYH